MDHKIISFDVETTGLRPYHGDKIFAYCIGYTDGNVDVFRLRKQKDCDKLQDLFYDTSIAKIAHNAKFELSMLKSNGIYVPEKTIWHDTMVMAQELDNTMISYDLDTLAWMFCFYPRGIDSKMKKRAKLLGGFHKVPAAEMEKYQKLDGERTMALYLTFKQFMDHGLYNDYMNEMDLIRSKFMFLQR